MPAPVQMPNAESQATLDQARAQAVGDLKGQLPASMLAPPPSGIGGIKTGLDVQVGQGPPPDLGSVPDEPTQTAEPVSQAYTPTPISVPVYKPEDEPLWRQAVGAAGRTAFAGLQGLGGAFNDLSTGIGQLTGAVPVLADKVKSLATGRYSTAMQDAWFRNFVDPGVENAQSFATDDKAHFVDKAMHAAGNMLGVVAQAVLTGGEGAELTPTNQALKSTGEVVTKAVTHGTRAMAVPAVASAVNKGRQVMATTGDQTAAVRAATVDYLTQTIGGILPLSAPGKLVQRAATGGTSAVMTGEMSREMGNQAVQGSPGASKVQEPFSVENMVLNFLSGTVMGGFGGERPTSFAGPQAKPGEPANVAPPDVTPDQTPPPPGTPDMPIEASPPPAEGKAVIPPKEGNPGEATPLPDKPTAEPAADLRAQLADMKDKDTPRSGVFLSDDNIKSLTDTQVLAELQKASRQGRAVVMDNGTLITKDVKTAQNYKRMLKSGADPQAVLGDATGAGTGKTADQTMVVQGRTPEGAVATEGVVSPAEVPGKVAEAQAQGKEPVVGTVEAALQRRAAEVATQEPTPTAQAVVAPSQERGIVKTGAGERAAIRAGADVEGKTPVHVLDEDGNPSDQVVHVPSDSWAPAAKPVPREAEKPEESTSHTVRNDNTSVTSEDHSTADEGTAHMEYSGATGRPQEWTSPDTGAHYTDISAHELEDGTKVPRQLQIQRKGKTATIEIGEKHEDLRDAVRNAESAIKGSDKASRPSDQGNQTREEIQAKESAPAQAPAETPKTKSGETGKTKSGETGKTSEAPLDQLKEAAATLRSQDIPGEGKKWAGKIPERASNIAEFARMLKAVAATMDGEDAKHAYDTAKKAEGLDLKTPEAMAKNQGIGHGEMNAHRDNLLNAAQKLIDPDFERPEPVKARAVKLAARQAAKPAKTEAAAAAEIKRLAAEQRAEKPVEKTKVIADVPDERQPGAKLTEGDKLKSRGAIKAYETASEKEAPGALARLEKVLDEHVAAGKIHPDDKDAAMAYAQSVRREALEKKRGKSRDEEIEEEFGDQRFEAESPRYYGSDHISDKIWGNHEAKLDKAGFLEFLGQQRDHNLHDLLDFIHGGMDAGAARSIVAGLRKYTPNIPVHFVDQVISRATGESKASGGLFTHDPATGAHDIQVRLTGESHPMRVLLHEAVHAATHAFIRKFPDHPLTKQIQSLHQIALERFLRQNAEAQANGADLARGPYGLHNADEFMAEALTNPDFMEHLVNSEKYASPTDQVLSIVHKLADTIKAMLGIKDGRESKLFNSVLDTTGQIMRAQHEMSTPQRDAILELHSLDEPRMIPNEDKIRGLAGGKAADTARQFWRSTRLGTLRTLRKLVMANETHDQLFRSNAHWFPEANNPVRALQDVEAQRTAISNRFMDRAGPIARDRAALSRSEDKALGELQRDATIYGVDPSLAVKDQLENMEGRDDFITQHDRFQQAYKRLSPEAQKVFNDERDFYKWAETQNRKTAIDVALDTYSDRDISDVQRRLLYSTRGPEDYDALIGHGGVIDVGDRNQALIDSLKNTAGSRLGPGPYFHLGRHGDLVVQVKPEGNKEFGSRNQAEAFANLVKSLSPTSKAKVEEIGSSFNVNYKADYVSMHENPAEAEAHAESLRRAGLEVGPVTEKVLSEDSSPLVPAAQKLVAEATRKLSRRGDPGKPPAPEVKALISNLNESIMSMLASRSAYAASKLARRGVGGVKGEEMGRNFAAYAQSAAWNNSHMATVFKSGEQLGKIRDMAKNPEPETPQQTVYRRGAFMTEISKRLTQDVAQRGKPEWAGFNRAVSRLGFLNYLFSPAHAAIWMTQNFTTGIPVAGARWGYGKTGAAFTKAMAAVAGPAFRQTLFEHVKPVAGKVFDADHILQSVVKAVEKSSMGKWSGHLDQLIKQGLVNTSFANELSNMSHGGWKPAERVFDYARLLPHMADVFNRTSSALAALEITGGDLAKALDFVKETHMDYGQGNKSRVFKAINRVPGFNSITMFRTYTQGMAHLLYSNVKNMALAESKSRGEAARTVAGMVLATSLFTGVIKGAVLEPLRLAVYAYNQLFGGDDEYHDLDNSIRKFVASLTGNDAATQAITGGLPRLLGFDLSSRMGLSDLFLHDPPDLLNSDKDHLLEFGGSLLGPMPQMIGDNYRGIRDHLQNGDPFGALMSAVPVKAFHDSQKAWELYSQGKQGTNGASLTNPSTGDALWQAFGLKPASVANEQERTGSAYGYRQFENTRKDELVKQYMSNPGNRGSVIDQVRAFNAAHPGDRITVSDFVRAQRAAQRAQALSRGQQVRDPGMQDMTEY